MCTIVVWLDVSSPPAPSAKHISQHMVHIFGLQASDTYATLAQSFLCSLPPPPNSKDMYTDV